VTNLQATSATALSDIDRSFPLVSSFSGKLVAQHLGASATLSAQKLTFVSSNISM
jgi:hypothetical protein